MNKDNTKTVAIVGIVTAAITIIAIVVAVFKHRADVTALETEM